MLFFFVLFASFARAELNFAVTSSGAEVSFKPHTGFHFNLDAPNKVRAGDGTDVPLARRTEAEMAFMSLAPQDFKLDLFVCDDAKTFCKKESAVVTVTARATNNVTLAEATGGAVGGATPGGLVEKYGFIMNDFDEALRRASQQKKLVLVDFSAIWCPACLKLEHEALDTAEFAKATKGLVKLRIDLDWEGSQAFRTRYHIKDVPTLVVIDANGEEITRFHGYRPRQVLLAEIAAALKKKPTTLAHLKERADKGDRAAADRAGRLAFDSLDYATAVKYLTATKKEKERLAIADIHLLEANQASGEMKQKLVTQLQEVTKAYPASADTPSRHLQTAELQKDLGQADAMKKSAQAALDSAAEMIAKATTKQRAKIYFSIDSSRDDTEVLIGDLYATQASALELLGRKEDSLKKWVDAIEATKASIKDPGDRGRSLILVRYLRLAGREDEIDPILERLQTQYPNEYTYYYKRANRFHDKGRFEDAAGLARKAVDNAYGSNLVDSALLLAKTLKAQKKPDEAALVASASLARVASPQEKDTHLAKQMEELRAYVK